MLVLVTGGTGFIGSHSVAAIRSAGHRVRLLVRDPARIPAALAPLGLASSDVEVATGDITDPASVRGALSGCSAVLHAAAVYSFDTRDRARMLATNGPGTEVVLAEARAAGADPIVHVSTFAVLAPNRDGRIDPTCPVADAPETYLASKAVADRIARRHQADGAPVVLTYPLATLGPDDPYLGDQTARLRNTLRHLVPVWPLGGFPIGDVRDVAQMHAAVLRPGQGPGRFLGPGRYVTTREYVRTLCRVTGRRLPTGYLPAAAMLPPARLAGLIQRMLPVHLPAEYGAIYTCAVSRPVDTSATDRLLGATGRPLAATMADTVAWLHASGRLGRSFAGHAATHRGRDGSTEQCGRTPGHRTPLASPEGASAEPERRI